MLITLHIVNLMKAQFNFEMSRFRIFRVVQSQFKLNIKGVRVKLTNTNLKLQMKILKEVNNNISRLFHRKQLISSLGPNVGVF